MGQETLPGIKDWSQKEILTWMESLGFEDFTNIIKYNKDMITGTDLVNADKNFLFHSLGITR